MNKDEFLGKLRGNTELTIKEKIEVCQYYIDNYPVLVGGIMIPLKGLIINGGSDMAVNHAFNQLKLRKDL